MLGLVRGLGHGLGGTEPDEHKLALKRSRNSSPQTLTDTGPAQDQSPCRERESAEKKERHLRQRREIAKKSDDWLKKNGRGRRKRRLRWL